MQLTFCLPSNHVLTDDDETHWLYFLEVCHGCLYTRNYQQWKTVLLLNHLIWYLEKMLSKVASNMRPFKTNLDNFSTKKRTTKTNCLSKIEQILYLYFLQMSNFPWNEIPKIHISSCYASYYKAQPTTLLFCKMKYVVWSSKISLKSVIFNFQFLIGL